MTNSAPPPRADESVLESNHAPDPAQDTDAHPTETPDAIIVVDHVSFAYPHRPGLAPGGEGDAPTGKAQLAVRDVSLTVHRGEYLAVLGRNGSGKSTLAKLMNGLLRPAAGEVRVRGWQTIDRRHLHEIRRTVGMVFQSPDNQMVATVVEEDVAFGLENYAVPRADMLERVTQALCRVDMEAQRKRPPHQLSGGQKQRVAIASVIAMQPQCIVFDEATSMLDVEGRREVTQLMRDLHGSGMAVVAITHHMEEALHADRVVVLDDGAVILEGTPREVFANLALVQNAGLDVPLPTDMAGRLNRAFPDTLTRLQDDVLTDEEFASTWETWRHAMPEGMPSAPAGMAKAAKAAEPGHIRPTDSAPDSAPAPSDAQDAYVIRVRDLSHMYLKDTPLAQPALDDVSLDIRRGEIVAIVGHTGSGKSTLVQHFNGLLTPQVGSVVVDGVELANPRADVKRVRRTVGLVFQNPEEQLFETLIGDDIAYGPFQFGLPLADVRNRVHFAMDWVGLDFAWRDRPVQALSGGQKRKVAIAGVLALRPQVMVLDEPTAGLDPQARDDLLANLRRLRDEYGVTLVIVTHQMEEVARLADRVLVLDHGRLAASSPTADLFRDDERLAALHLGRPDTVQLLRTLQAAGEPVDPVQLTRDAAMAELCRVAVTPGPTSAGAAPHAESEVAKRGDS